MKIIDMHCDTISSLWEKREAGGEAFLRKNEGHLDLERMRASGYLLQNFALFVNIGKIEEPWDMVCELYRLYREEIQANGDLIAPVLRYEDIDYNRTAGKMSAMLTVEEGAVCGGDIRKLRKLYEMGVRMLTLAWNYPNELGYPGSDGEMGLTETGKEFVVEMEKLGMIPDVSHLSDAGFYDVLEITQKPFVASHSNARSVCSHVRNLSDHMIRKLAERGGCMGLNFYAPFLKKVTRGEKKFSAISDVVRHARHITDQGGIDVLGLGSDFDGIDTNEELPGAQSMGFLWDALHRSGYQESELDKIFYKNVLRVYREIL